MMDRCAGHVLVPGYYKADSRWKICEDTNFSLCPENMRKNDAYIYFLYIYWFLFVFLFVFIVFLLCEWKLLCQP